MNSPDAVHTTNLESLPKIYSGKVRDIFAVSDDHLLIVATDRISAYDVILPGVIPGKGKLLTELCLLYTSPSPRDQRGSRMPSSA